jgi:hypothetical protein
MNPSEKVQNIKHDLTNLYKEANEAGKQFLKDAFPSLFTPIMERVKNWQDILEISGETLTIPNPVTDRQVALNAMDMMLIARDVISEGWEADYSDKNQPKWEVVYKWDDYISGFGFLDSFTYRWDGSAVVGARLVFETKEKARFFTTIMMEYINQFLIKNYNPTKNEN